LNRQDAKDAKETPREQQKSQKAANKVFGLSAFPSASVACISLCVSSASWRLGGSN
jgi:hypothetical protein